MNFHEGKGLSIPNTCVSVQIWKNCFCLWPVIRGSSKYHQGVA